MSIGERLREERERLGFTQPAFAGLAETTKKSQIDYEKDLTQPKAGYLAAIAKVGADVQYIVTGVCSVAALTADEELLLQTYRALDASRKAGALGAVVGLQQTTGTTQTFNAPVSGGVAGKNIINKGPEKK